jgi:hypothetical protein
MVDNYKVRAGDIERTYLCGSARVASKRFLSYLRVYRKERPTRLEISKGNHHFKAEVEWYVGTLEESSFTGAEGEWWRLLAVTRA